MDTTLSKAVRHWKTVLSRWPKDLLRPDFQLQTIIGKRLEERLSGRGPAVSAAEASVQAEALNFLIHNKFQQKYPLPDAILRPQGNPTYYEDLIKDLDEAPTRTWMTSFWIWLKGKIRL